MLSDKWIIDRTPTTRFPFYTRGNAADVLADPVSPLGWTFCWESGIVLGCRDGFVTFGVFDADDYGTPPETFGCFGGYFYNSLMQARLMGVRMPGASPEAIDAAYFDDRPDVPPYVPEPWHDSPRHAEKLAETQAYIMSAVTHQPVEDQHAIALEIRRNRPDLSKLSNEELVARARTMQPHLVAMFEQHAWASLGASFGPGGILAIAEGLGRAEDGVRMIGAVGNVDSANIATQLWDMSRIVRSDASLTQLFDISFASGTIDSVTAGSMLIKIAGSKFSSALQTFMIDHGGRAPNEWDPAAFSYESRPSLAFIQIDRLRRQDDSADPHKAHERNSAERERLYNEFMELLSGDPETSGAFAASYASSGVWQATRERCKSNNIAAIHEVRVCFDEIGRRMVAAGHLGSTEQVYMLLESELSQFLGDPASFKDVLAERFVDHQALALLDPPYIIGMDVPPLSQWPRRDKASTETVKVGDVLKGVACSAGEYTGTARIILDPFDPSGLEAGDILVTLNTDPSWTPLFLASGAVVVNLGAVGSHASIVSRELGIPCVASVADATKKIPDGANITVNGSNGTITINSL
jgi:phosphohistidine swiveling domain-containing protein